ncbi:HAD hydrolase family protein [Candidatus Sumerlaeota bacterium]|nr:HAD hydrolase family protein [Candidatus Sumerlaeota bacterium]
MNRLLKAKIERIKILLLDVDGVLTDGRIVYDSRGQEIKFFDVHDGIGVHALRKAGIPTILVTAKGSPAIAPRARDMGVAEVISDTVPKARVLGAIVAKYGVAEENLCFVGDDLLDLSIMKRVGCAVAVANACAEVKQAADLATKREGGRGAVREVAELILRTQGKWESIVEQYADAQDDADAREAPSAKRKRRA